MNNIMEKFIKENKGLKIEVLNNANSVILIIKNCSFKKGEQLCNKYGSSGYSVGKQKKDFAILNFGMY